MVSYDKNFGAYLESLGMPSFLIPIIKGIAEKVTIAPSSDPNGVWNIYTKTGEQTRRITAQQTN
jgi:hypothetical protein